ncbi:mucin-5AC [Scaptodrosophila lebanonensis]|uniref:protein-tyrosine-phosphatase n=1 Tax=Drosophila lebanonensis TaxID=7225 RepID=A0A6J2TFQ3_DROLE|nr:mucin-5AC [Scaptodrosophila lebanonensis]
MRATKTLNSWLPIAVGACVLLACIAPTCRARFIAKRETSHEMATTPDPDTLVTSTYSPTSTTKLPKSSESAVEGTVTVSTTPEIATSVDHKLDLELTATAASSTTDGTSTATEQVAFQGGTTRIVAVVAEPGNNTRDQKVAGRALHDATTESSSSPMPPKLAVTPMKLHALITTTTTPTPSTTKATTLGAQPTISASHENSIDESAVSNNGMRLLPEKRGKFISENSTNSQQLSWPNAAEAWSLAAMKAVPKAGHFLASPTTTITSTTRTPPNGTEVANEIEWQQQHGLLAGQGEGEGKGANQTDLLNEKNLVDWQHIMMHGALENRTEFVFSSTADATEGTTQAATAATKLSATTTTTTASQTADRHDDKTNAPNDVKDAIETTTTTPTLTPTITIKADATTQTTAPTIQTTTTPTTTPANELDSNMAMKAHEINENADKTNNTSSNNYDGNERSNQQREDDVIAIVSSSAITATTTTTTTTPSSLSERTSSAPPITVTVSTQAAGEASTSNAEKQQTSTTPTATATTTSATTSTTVKSLPIKAEEEQTTDTIAIATTTASTTTTQTPTQTEIGQISNEVNLETITLKSVQIKAEEAAATTTTTTSSDVNELLITNTTAATTTTTATYTTTEATTAGKANNSATVENITEESSTSPATTTTTTTTTTAVLTTTTTTTPPTPTLFADLKETHKTGEQESSLETNKITETVEATAESKPTTTTPATATTVAGTTAEATATTEQLAKSDIYVVEGGTEQPNALGESDEGTATTTHTTTTARAATKATLVAGGSKGETNEQYEDNDDADDDVAHVDENNDDEQQLLSKKTTMATLSTTNATPPTTTTTTTPEGPLISLLDDSTTSTTTTTTTTKTTIPTTTSRTTTEQIPTITAATRTTTIRNNSNNSTDIYKMLPVETTTPNTNGLLVKPTNYNSNNNSINPDLETLQQPNSTNAHGETDVNVIIAITVSVIGVVALILLVAFLYLMRKRQKQMSYGQRCRPVSLDDYSLDNVSVLGSVRRKGRDLRASKRTYGNAAFDDPSLRHNVLSATELGKFVERRSSIFEEFRDVPQIIARADEVPTGCEDKNRYANVIPLPETRVVLQRQGDDEKTEYINANYVRGPNDAPNYYIACQAPLESTISDFWRMIWEQQSRVIIQASDLVENGVERCAEYLPPSATLDNHSTYGDFQVTLKNREVKDKYAISTLMLKRSDGNESRELTHYWYKWPETGVPAEEAPIIAMLLEARSSLKSYAIEQANELKEKSSTLTLKSMESSVDADTKKMEASSTSSGGSGSGSNEINGNLGSRGARNQQGPLTVHCSPGTGRTGTIIGCDLAIRSLETPKQVDIPQLVYYVRRGRASAVQTKEQYEFIYKVANMYATKITNLSNDN